MSLVAAVFYLTPQMLLVLHVRHCLYFFIYFLCLKALSHQGQQL